MSASHDKRDPAFIYELAREGIAHQLSAADGLDAKIATLMAVGSTLIGIASAMLVVKALSDRTVIAVALSVGIPWVILSVLSVRAYRVLQFNACPDLDEVWRDYDSVALGELQWNAANTLKSYFHDNLGIMKSKADAVSRGLVCLIIETIMVAGWFTAIAFGLDL